MTDQTYPSWEAIMVDLLAYAKSVGLGDEARQAAILASVSPRAETFLIQARSLRIRAGRRWKAADMMQILADRYDPNSVHEDVVIQKNLFLNVVQSVSGHFTNVFKLAITALPITRVIS